jgi:aspartyl-tRNA(Asn)/glutamyl-tRNA(Gln) amidotransferase subunit A
VYYIIAPAEASSNLSRFDGVKFGHRAAQYDDLMEMYKKSRSEGFGPEVQKRIMIGTYVLSHGYYDAYYLKAQQIRRLIAQDFQQAFTQCDVIAGPVSPTVAWGIGEKTDDPVASYLPVGLQLIGNYCQEARLLHTAHQFQQVTDWHTRAPAAFSA